MALDHGTPLVYFALRVDRIVPLLVVVELLNVPNLLFVRLLDSVGVELQRVDLKHMSEV